MKANLRSVLAAGVILAVVVVAALLATRAASDVAEPPQTWIPPAGFEEVASVQPTADTRVALWLGRAGPPKPSDCWHLVHTGGGGYFSLGGCGGEPGQPWIVRLAGIMAGGTGDDAARWVRIAGGNPIAVTRGHFLAIGAPSTQTVPVELLDEHLASVAEFPDVRVGGEGG